jgi:hypothetical protein
MEFHLVSDIELDYIILNIIMENGHYIIMDFIKKNRVREMDSLRMNFIYKPRLVLVNG